MKTNAVVTRRRSTQAEAVIYRVAMLRREMLDEADVWVSDGSAASLLLFMSRRLWSLRRNLLGDDVFLALGEAGTSPSRCDDPFVALAAPSFMLLLSKMTFYFKSLSDI